METPNFIYLQTLSYATMKNLVFLLLIFTATSYGQIHEIGVFVGGANPIADVGSTNYINPSKVAFGGLYKWNKSRRHSWRLSATYAKLTGNDLKADDSRRKQRGYRFDNNILEVSAGLEFTFIEWDLHQRVNSILSTTPYLYTGISFFNYDALAINPSNNLLQRYTSHQSLAIPMVIGIKTALTRRFVLALELGARYTFTDNIDGSNPTGSKAEFDSLKFGNVNSNDWYVFTGVTLTYTFGQNPCFCNF